MILRGNIRLRYIEGYYILLFLIFNSIIGTKVIEKLGNGFE